MTESSALYDWLILSVNKMQMTEVDSVSQWLEDLRLTTDTECMCVLQGKSLNKDCADVVFASSKNNKDYIDSIRGRAHVISAEFSKLYRKLEKERWKHVKSSALRLTCQIRSLLHECNASIANPHSEFTILQQKVMESSAKLAQHVELHLDVINGHRPQQAPVLQLLTQLGQSFSALVDKALCILVKRVIQGLQDNKNVYSITSILNNIVTLGLEGEHMCYLVSKEGGVKLLFDICRNLDLQQAHGAALRAIATICCVPESIAELEKVGGVECLSDMLAEHGQSECVRCEAAGVVAQITSPCLDYYQHMTGFIEHMDDLVCSLTGLCQDASNHEVFLLGAAALANMTFMDSMACEFLAQYGTAKVLIEACHLDKASTLFAKDQVATILANMSAIENCCMDITDSHGVALLVQFLMEEVPSGNNKANLEAELAACERVQQKAAIALTRLGRDPENAQLVVELHGIPRLAQLCRDPASRNHSDAVLVACLAALRKISASCGHGDFEKQDIQQLITPRLTDSYHMCSNMDESFV